MTLVERHQITSAKRVVVKVGSSSISGDNASQIDPLVAALAAAHRRGVEVVLVSSGAIATGLPILGIEARPDDLATQQAAASVGQNLLIARYQRLLEKYDIVAGQILLTSGDLGAPVATENARRAIDRLLQLRVLPIVNENDTVATAEISFGDNDRLAALVAELLCADILVLLSDVDALYTKPPHLCGAHRISTVPFGDPLAGVEIGAARSRVGTGGAVTKVSAARLAAVAGIPVLVTAATLIAEALDGADIGTWFVAR